MIEIVLVVLYSFGCNSSSGGGSGSSNSGSSSSTVPSMWYITNPDCIEILWFWDLSFKVFTFSFFKVSIARNEGKSFKSQKLNQC